MSLRQRVFSVFFAIALAYAGYADLISHTGNVDFDVNSDSNTEMLLTNDGLGIGTTASSNLHVVGNAVFSVGNVGIATTNPSSSLVIQGSMGMNLESVSSNTTLSSNTFVVADTSAGNVTLTLPVPNDIAGRMYRIKKLSNSNTLIVNSSKLIDESIDLQLTSATNSATPYVDLITNGSRWFITGQSGGATKSDISEALDNSVTSGTSGIAITDKKYGASFVASATGRLSKVEVNLYRYVANTSYDCKVEIWSADSNGLPSIKLGDLGTIAWADVDQTYSFRTVVPTLDNSPAVTAGTRYCLVFYAENGSGSTYAIQANGFVSATSIQIFDDSGWKAPETSNYRIYVSGNLDNSSDTVGAPNYGITVNDHFAFQFTAADSGNLTKYEQKIYLYAGSLAAMNVLIYDDSNDNPGSLVSNGNLGRIPNGSMDATYTIRSLDPADGSQPVLSSGNKYWVVFHKDNNDGAGNLAIQMDYTNQKERRSSDGGSTWLQRNIQFKTYITSQ